jgi:nucleotide-binding universal stress UspA family protein
MSSDGPVIIAYDGSDFAKSAIDVASRQLRSDRPALVLTVCEPFSTLALGGAVVTPDVVAEVERGVLEQAQQVADEGVALARAAGFDAQPLVERGQPAWKVIVEVADAHGASLTVLGSHGRSGLKEVLLGSVAGSVASHSDRPVLISH